MEPIPLRDGRLVRIRPVTVADAAGLLVCERACVEAGDGVVTTADDLPATVAAYADELRASLPRREGQRGLWLVAEPLAWGGPSVLGHVTVARLRPSLIRHVAVLAIQVHPAAQGLGLGRALMERAIARADRLGLKRLELYVRADNARARRLYASLGFAVEGVRRAFVRLPDGAFVDDVVMGRVRAG